MPYDDDVVDRIREIVSVERAVTEKRMFGGVAFLIDGRMAVAASSRGGLLLRIDPAQTESLVHEPSVRRAEMRGREMTGWLHVNPEAFETEDDLRRWVQRGVTVARSLPPR